jgi:predicted NUDIX family phosphoesterase
MEGDETMGLKEELLKSVEGKTFEEVLALRDSYNSSSEEWWILNEKKAEILEAKKPSTKEEIVYFDETALLDIPEGFTPIDSLPKIPYKTAKRSLLEYNPEQRHPIPYCIVRHKKYYFFILRENGSGEIRLIGKKGLLGGHIGKEDIDPLSLNKTILNGLKRELYEEAGITDDMVENVRIRGLIKGNEGVDSDHLGIVYEIRLNTDQIRTQEDGVITGIWIHEKDLKNHYDSFESWAKIVYDHLLSKK